MKYSDGSDKQSPSESGDPRMLLTTLALAMVAGQGPSDSLIVKRNIPYAKPAHERQVLDVYAPYNAKNLPVVFWKTFGLIWTLVLSPVCQHPREPDRPARGNHLHRFQP
jgi:hypothetical protein